MPMLMFVLFRCNTDELSMVHRIWGRLQFKTMHVC